MILTPSFSVGSARKWFAHHTLNSLQSRLRALSLRRGREAEHVPILARETGASAVCWNKSYALDKTATDQSIKTCLKNNGVDAFSLNGTWLREPRAIETKTQGPYRVSSPFWNSLRTQGPSRTAEPDPPVTQAAEGAAIPNNELDDRELLPTKPNWALALGDEWSPDEFGAAAGLARYLAAPVRQYGEDRNRPDICGASRLSPHFALGTVSPLTVWSAAQDAIGRGEIPRSEGLKFLSEIRWREFSNHRLRHDPEMPTTPLRIEFAGFPWREDQLAPRIWSRRRTGVPIFNAAMRKLWQTGWMPKRVRMNVAGFLAKSMLTPWQMGERWFWDTMIGADPANTTASWQWVAGCGVDAAPYFRIFNPVTQGEKFDPAGDYRRRYVAEVAPLPDDLIHAPRRAPSAPRPHGYPAPIIDLDQTRRSALHACDVMKSQARQLAKQVAKPYMKERS